MPAYTLAHLSDAALLSGLRALVATDRETTARLLAHIAEVDARDLCRPAGYSSTHVYCVRVLHLADEVAFKRIRAARLGRRYPQVLDAIADGRLHVTGVAMLAPHVTDDNVDEVIAAATRRTRSELEILVARLAPRPDLPTRIRALPARRDQPRQPQLDPVPAHAPADPTGVTAVAPPLELAPVTPPGRRVIVAA
jgi:hypothetical protein